MQAELKQLIKCVKDHDMMVNNGLDQLYDQMRQKVASSDSAHLPSILSTYIREAGLTAGYDDDMDSCYNGDFSQAAADPALLSSVQELHPVTDDDVKFRDQVC